MREISKNYLLPFLSDIIAFLLSTRNLFWPGCMCLNCLNSLFLQTFEQKQKEEKRDSRNSWESEMSVDSLTSVNSILSEEGSVTSVGSFSDVAVGGAETTDAVGADRKAYDSLRKKINTDNDNG